MTRSSLIGLSVLLLACPALPRAGAAEKEEKEDSDAMRWRPTKEEDDALRAVMERHTTSVYRLRSASGRELGTAFCIHRTRRLLVAVTEALAGLGTGEDLFAIQGATGTEYPVHHVWTNPRKPLALMKLWKDGPDPPTAIPAGHATHEGRTAGKAIGLVSFPAFTSATRTDHDVPGPLTSTGVIHSEREQYSPILGHTAFAWFGSEGAPLLDRNGLLAGVHSNLFFVTNGITAEAGFAALHPSHVLDVIAAFFPGDEGIFDDTDVVLMKEPHPYPTRSAPERSPAVQEILKRLAALREREQYREVIALVNTAIAEHPREHTLYKERADAYALWFQKSQASEKPPSPEEIKKGGRWVLNDTLRAILLAPHDALLHTRLASDLVSNAHASGDARGARGIFGALQFTEQLSKDANQFPQQFRTDLFTAHAHALILTGRKEEARQILTREEPNIPPETFASFQKLLALTSTPAAPPAPPK